MRTYENWLLLISLSASGWAAEQRVKMSDLPSAVRAAVKEQNKGASLRGLSKEVEHGKTSYEVEMLVNGHSKDIEMDSTGAIVEVEEEVSLANIPEAARTAIEKAAQGGHVLKVESVTHGNSIVAYEASMTKAGKHSEVRVNPEGKPAP